VTLNANVAYGDPVALDAGVNFNLFESRSALTITWFKVQSVPSSFKAPAVSSVVILTDFNVLLSPSAKPKSAVAMVKSVS